MTLAMEGKLEEATTLRSPLALELQREVELKTAACEALPPSKRRKILLEDKYGALYIARSKDINVSQAAQAESE